MKRTVFTLGFIVSLLLCAQNSDAQIPGVGLVTGVIKKVIVALDLKVQQMQNKTLALQNAQKELENRLSLGKLGEINGWLGQEKELYQSYYRELAKVKAAVSDYRTVRKTISQQLQLVGEYKMAWSLFRNDQHFSPAELQYMSNIYGGILQESLKNLDELLLAITDAQTQMDDGERLQLISHASGGLQTNLDHLRQFNGQNAGLSYSRSRDAADREQVRKLYGLK